MIFKLNVLSWKQMLVKGYKEELNLKLEMFRLKNYSMIKINSPNTFYAFPF